MTAKNYFFTLGMAATALEQAQNDKLGFVLVNGMYGDTFQKEVGKCAGKVPSHLKEKEVDLPEVDLPEVDLPEVDLPAEDVSDDTSFLTK